MTPIAIPLAVLLSSLITFGNLGEHFELTAIKASGISLLRALLPIFLFVLLLTVLAFYSNNNFVPRAALEAYSLLYDIKQKKPSMDLKEGAFYNGIPDISIKVEKKHEDGQTLNDIIIYDHSQKNGNKEVTIADSGKMYTMMNERYLALELFDGNTYVEGTDVKKPGKPMKQDFTQSSFKKSQIILDLSSFQLDRTDKDLFSSDRNMRNLSELEHDVDSMKSDMLENQINNFILNENAFTYLNRDEKLLMPDYLIEYREEKIRRQDASGRDTITDKTINGYSTLPPVRNLNKPIAIDTDNEPVKNNNIKKRHLLQTVRGPKVEKAINELKDKQPDDKIYNAALSSSRQLKSRIEGNKARLERAEYQKNVFEIQWHKIISNSFACVIMFLIGAPLGAIIKRGGLGVPVLVSILFFIIFYIFNMMGEKYAKQDIIDPWLGIWSANILLLPIGLFFLRQARIDARLFDSDFYNVILERINRWISRKRRKKIVAATS